MCAKKMTDSIKTKKNTAETTTKTSSIVVGKKKLVVSYKNLPPDVVELVKEKYPRGYAESLMKVNKGDGQFFYAITLDTETTDYLIKVDVKIDSELEEIEKALFDQPDTGIGEEEDFPEASFDEEESEEED